MSGPSPWERKLDHRLRALLARAGSAAGGPGRSVQIFVRFAGPPDRLAAHGIRARSVAGDIATASVRLSDIPRAASAPEIIFLELAQPVWPDPDVEAGAGGDGERTSKD